MTRLLNTIRNIVHTTFATPTYARDLHQVRKQESKKLDHYRSLMS